MSRDAERVQQLRDLFHAHGWKMTQRSTRSAEARFKFIVEGAALHYHKSKYDSRIAEAAGVWLVDQKYILMICDEDEAHKRIAMIDMLRSTWRDTPG